MIYTNRYIAAAVRSYETLGFFYYYYYFFSITLCTRPASHKFNRSNINGPVSCRILFRAHGEWLKSCRKHLGRCRRRVVVVAYSLYSRWPPHWERVFHSGFTNCKQLMRTKCTTYLAIRTNRWLSSSKFRRMSVPYRPTKFYNLQAPKIIQNR